MSAARHYVGKHEAPDPSETKYTNSERQTIPKGAGPLKMQLTSLNPTGPVVTSRLRSLSDSPRTTIDRAESGLSQPKASAIFAGVDRPVAAIATCGNPEGTAKAHAASNWAYTPKFGMNYHSQRWRSAT